VITLTGAETESVEFALQGQSDLIKSLTTQLDIAWSALKRINYGGPGCRPHHIADAAMKEICALEASTCNNKEDKEGTQIG
jgi:hypothetical protein